MALPALELLLLVLPVMSVAAGIYLAVALSRRRSSPTPRPRA
ncbi:MAG: hypothetical protein OEV62_10640 [Actinomycetota bacterium]|nr:hypothetical protein [Actinomycetota bacterium]MDH5277856.1 hypothetical protein [Actinomycetota bacterium]